MTRVCIDCGAAVTAKSKSGRCQPCAARARVPTLRVVAARARRNSNAAPAGFALSAPRLTMKQLRERYGRSAYHIHRWCTETGVRPLHVGRVRALPPARKLEQSIAGRAVEESLRRFGPVFRCDATGAPIPDGFFWNRGGRILSDDDVIERAEALGWDRDAWRKAA